MINLDRLQTWLNQSNLQSTNPPAFQTIEHLIRAVRELQNNTIAALADAAGTVTGLENADLLTHSDESALLPNSRELIAGTGVTFDDTIVHQRIVNATGGGSGAYYDSPLTDGDLDETDLIFAGGDCIIVQVPV